MAMAAADPSPAAVMTWARAFATLPATHTPATLVQTVTAGDRPTGLVEVASESATSRSLFGTNRGGTNSASQATVRSPSSSTPRRRSSSTRSRCAIALGDADPSRAQLLPLRGRECPAWSDVHEVFAPLAHDLGIADGCGRAAQHSELPIAHFEAVTVGAVQDVAGPPLRKTRYVGQSRLAGPSSRGAGALESQGPHAARLGSRAAVAHDLVDAVVGRSPRRSPRPPCVRGRATRWVAGRRARGTPACARRGRCVANRHRSPRPDVVPCRARGPRSGRPRRRRQPPRHRSECP